MKTQIVVVGGGAGGHASEQSAFSLVREIREFWDGCLVLGGGINDGYQIRAAEMLGDRVPVELVRAVLLELPSDGLALHGIHLSGVASVEVVDLRIGVARVVPRGRIIGFVASVP